MSAIDFLATFGSDESMAKVFYFYLKSKALLAELKENETGKVLNFFQENNDFLEKEVRKSFIQGDGLVMFEKVRLFIKNNE